MQNNKETNKQKTKSHLHGLLELTLENCTEWVGAHTGHLIMIHFDYPVKAALTEPARDHARVLQRRLPKASLGHLE